MADKTFHDRPIVLLCEVIEMAGVPEDKIKNILWQ
jgi:hypothetical protein